MCNLGGLLQHRRGRAIFFDRQIDRALDELLRYSDRILVFFAGKVLRELVVAGTDTEELGYLIGGKDRA